MDARTTSYCWWTSPPRKEKSWARRVMSAQSTLAVSSIAAVSSQRWASLVKASMDALKVSGGSCSSVVSAGGAGEARGVVEPEVRDQVGRILGEGREGGEPRERWARLGPLGEPAAGLLQRLHGLAA